MSVVAPTMLDFGRIVLNFYVLFFNLIFQHNDKVAAKMTGFVVDIFFTALISAAKASISSVLNSPTGEIRMLCRRWEVKLSFEDCSV